MSALSPSTPSTITTRIRDRLSHLAAFALTRRDFVAPSTSIKASEITLEDGHAEALSYRVHVSRRSPEPGATRPVFVMVHGIGMSHRYYDKLRDELIDYGDTVILDLPGFGGTSTPGRALTIEDYAAVINHALHSEGITSCVLIGHSMGAQFTTELAIGYPGLVSHLVLIGPVTDTSHRSAIRHTLALAADMVLERPITDFLVTYAYLQCGVRWYLTMLPAMLAYSLDARLRRVTQPVLIVRGTRDLISDRTWCRRLRDAHLGARLVEIPGQPHAAHRGGEHPTSTAILELLGTARTTTLERITADNPYDDQNSQNSVSGGDRVTVSARFTRSTPGPDRLVEHPVYAERLSITVADRQCDAYVIRQRPPDEPQVDQSTPPRRFVLIPGIGVSHRYFQRLGAHLSSQGDVYLLDLPGNGRTEHPLHRITNTTTAALLERLLDEVEVRGCVLVAHSMGAQSATELAIERPDLVSHVVLIGPAVDADHSTLAQQALSLGLNSILEKPTLNVVQFLDVLRCGPRWYLAQLATLMTYRLEHRLPLVEHPVLILRGTRDPVARSTWCHDLAILAPRGKSLEIHGASHAVHFSAPTVVAAAITAFLHDAPALT